MGEFIADNFKREAMKVPLLRELLMTDQRLYRLQHHLRQSGAAVDLSGQAGRSGQGRRAPLPNTSAARPSIAQAEIAAMLDTTRFIDRARDIYGYHHFVCDTSGSICEVVEADDPADPVMTELVATICCWSGSRARTPTRPN